MKQARQGYEVTNDIGKGKLLWGPAPVGTNGRIVGTFKRPAGDEGALILFMDTSCFVQGNAGVVRSVPSMVLELAAKANCNLT